MTHRSRSPGPGRKEGTRFLSVWDCGKEPDHTKRHRSLPRNSSNRAPPQLRDQFEIGLGGDRLGFDPKRKGSSGHGGGRGGEAGCWCWGHQDRDCAGCSRRKSFLERCNPELAEVILRTDAVSNSLVDLQEDILRQFEEKGCAQIGAKIMDCGRTRLVRLPHAF